MYNQERAHFRFSREEYKGLLLATARKLRAQPEADAYILLQAEAYALAAEHLAPADFFFLDLADLMSLLTE